VQATETGIEDDTPQPDTCLTDASHKHLLDSSEDSSVDIPRIKTARVDAENVTSD